MNKTTESDSYYDSLEQMSTANLLANINKEDKMVALIVEKQIPQIEKLVNAIVPKMKKGGCENLMNTVVYEEFWWHSAKK